MGHVNLPHLVSINSVGSVQNERTLSVMNYIKNDHRNKLAPLHLNSCVRLNKWRWSLASFPIDLAVTAWYAAKGRRH